MAPIEASWPTLGNPGLMLYLKEADRNTHDVIYLLDLEKYL